MSSSGSPPVPTTLPFFFFILFSLTKIKAGVTCRSFYTCSFSGVLHDGSTSWCQAQLSYAFDPFGDAFYEEVTVASLKAVLERIPDAEAGSAVRRRANDERLGGGGGEVG